MGRFDGKVVFITGIARGQGRSHALSFAEEGADIVGVDPCVDIPTAPFDQPTEADLAETVKLVEKTGRRIQVSQTDVRDLPALQQAFDAGVETFGHIDIIVINHGTTTYGPVSEQTPEVWRDNVDINLIGAWNAASVAIPHLVERGEGGSITITSSWVGLRGVANVAAYISSKHGVVGLMRALAAELGPHNIRVNTVHPTQCRTPMCMNEGTARVFRPDLEHPTEQDLLDASQATHLLPVPVIEPVDISNAIMFLASEQGRYITGVTLPVDCGASAKS